MDDIRYQLDMLTAMNKTYAANEKIYKLICQASKKVFIYFNPTSGLLRSYGHWNDYFDFILNDYSDLLRTLDILEDEYREPVRDLFFVEKTGKDSGSLIAKLKDGKTFVEVVATVVKEKDGTVLEKLITFTDVTHRENLKNDLSYMAYYDLMTNLYNRNYYVQKLSNFIEKAEKEKTVVSVMMINIDDFHKINDSLGIIYGDEIIQDFGLFLNSFVDGESVIGARFDGDIYSLAIYDPAGSKSVEGIYSRIKERLKEPFRLTNGSDVSFTVSVGVAEYPESGSTALELCNGGEVVILKVKEAGKNGMMFFDTQLLNDFKEMVSMETRLKEAIRDMNFFLNYQPQYDAKTRHLRGVESLIRWNKEGEKLISPAVFIPIAEKIGVIVAIGDWVLEKSISTYMEWKRKYDTDITISVNISSIQYRQPDFVSKVVSVISRYDMKPENLELEITESVLIEDAETVFEKMEELRDFGIKISIDDFGTGYSSLSYLKRLPADTLKIDKSFIDTVVTDEPSKIIVSSIIELAKKLGFETIAEGVENEEQLNYLKDAGCDVIQGFYLGKPKSQEELEDILLRMI